MTYKLTKNGKQLIKLYIDEIKSKRKEILDAGLDTCTDTDIPTPKDIIEDVNYFGVDEDGDYYNCWGVTDNYNTDYPLTLKLGKDII